ncbi:MAG TPA: hypothetical protein VML75_11325 [Kofleriaceae bacterium]|nr:hypothetical protein [Kofleriaceae bacterium]
MRALALGAVVLVLAGAPAPAHGQKPGTVEQPPGGGEPIAPLEIIRSPIRSATVEQGCRIGVLSVSTRARLPDRSEQAGQLGFFGRCRVARGLQLRAAMPFVVNRWHSNFESTSHSEWGSPSLEVRLQVMRLRWFRLAAYLAGAINWQQRSSVVTETEVTGLVEPGFAASTIYRGLSVHANAEANLPFGARNSRRTFLIGAAFAYRPRHGVSLHAGYQNAIDPIDDRYWADARAFILGARMRLSRGWAGELGTRLAVNPEAELEFNSLGRVATLINFLYEVRARPAR